MENEGAAFVAFVCRLACEWFERALGVSPRHARVAADEELPAGPLRFVERAADGVDGTTLAYDDGVAAFVSTKGGVARAERIGELAEGIQAERREGSVP